MAAKNDHVEVVVQSRGGPIVRRYPSSSVQLGFSDRPYQVRIRVYFVGKVTVDFDYPAGMEEERRSVRANHVECFVGAYSRRLLGMALTFRRTSDVESSAKALTRELVGALERLKEQSEYSNNIGTRMNREAVERDLELEGSIPPPWMMDALQRAKTAGRVSTG